MKTVVISDSHGNYRNFKKILDTNSDADYIIHLGDGENDLYDLNIDDSALAKKIIYVGGNCDMGMHKRTRIVEIDGIRIFLAHGDNYKIKTDKKVIAKAAEKEGCSAAFFGHSHIRYCETIGGIFLLNPGSCDMQDDGTRPSYAVVTTENGSISAEFTDL
ncbi:MAG: metallophosphoesterase [Ruminiclostridium sp.]|nr:metallophosphoesterase [Ruminiclostridium sp.]